MLLKKSFVIHLCCQKNIVLGKLTISQTAIYYKKYFAILHMCYNMIIKNKGWKLILLKFWYGIFVLWRMNLSELFNIKASLW